VNYDNSLVVTITVTCNLWAPFSGDHLFTCGAIYLPPQSSKTDGNKSADLKPMSDRWPKESFPRVFLCKSLCWKKVLMMHTALLQQDSSVVIYISITRANHTLT